MRLLGFILLLIGETGIYAERFQGNAEILWFPG